MGAAMPVCDALATPGGAAVIACAALAAILLTAIWLGFLALRRCPTSIPARPWQGIATTDPGLRIIWQLARGAAPRAHVVGGRG